MSEEEDPRVPMCGMPRTPAPVPPMENKIETPKMKRQPLPCIVCGVQPAPAWTDDEGTYQPSSATMFSAGHGHYGSTVWDEMSPGRTLEIVICDDCLVKHRDRAAVCITPPPVRQEAQFIPWRSEKIDDDLRV